MIFNRFHVNVEGFDCLRMIFNQFHVNIECF